MRKISLSIATALWICCSFGAEAAKLCPTIFKPVCAEKHGTFKTYSNACFAHVAHARVIANCSCVKG